MAQERTSKPVLADWATWTPRTSPDVQGKAVYERRRALSPEHQAAPDQEQVSGSLPFRNSSSAFDAAKGGILHEEDYLYLPPKVLFGSPYNDKTALWKTRLCTRYQNPDNPCDFPGCSSAHISGEDALGILAELKASRPCPFPHSKNGQLNRCGFRHDSYCRPYDEQLSDQIPSADPPIVKTDEDLAPGATWALIRFVTLIVAILYAMHLGI